MEYSIRELEDMAKEMRLNIVKMIGVGKTGHIGGSCSIADVVTVLYFYKMNIDPKDAKWEDRDRFVMSKGHAALAQYAALSKLGFFAEEELAKLKKLGAVLQGHPDMAATPGIEANTGSLGQGLSIACGMAAGAKLDKKEYKVYCVVGDGEMGEGQIWEAGMAAAHHKLDNLTVILDRNGIQAMGPTAKRLDSGPLEDKWRAFGWHVIVIDGHSIEQIIDALEESDHVTGKPTMIIADTIKGKGICFAENTAVYHNGAMTKEQYELACIDLCSKEEV